MNDLITIIVPIYNVSSYLDRCITSIINQTYKHLQILLVDDGSTDNSIDICRIYQSKDARIEIVHKENGGLVSARKAGIRIATGKYVGYVDGDDWIEPDMYERLYHEATISDADVIESDHYIDYEGHIKRVKSKVEYGCFDVKEIIPVMMCDDNFNECRIKPYICSKLFKRSLLVDVQIAVKERIGCGEDAAVVYPYLLKSKKVCISDYAGYHYVQRKGSITNISYIDELERNKILIQYLLSIFKQSAYADFMIEQLNQYTKLSLLLRQISFFDKASPESFLKPFGGITEKSKVVIYGAGKLGQSIFKYILEKGKLEIVSWLDQEYKMYQLLDMPVNNPIELTKLQGKYDKIIIAVSSKKVADSIKSDLCKMSVEENDMVWLSDDFINKEYNMLEKLFNEKL